MSVVLCLVDAEDPTKAMGEVNKVAAMGDCSLVCAWSAEEAARYIETSKAYENKSSKVGRCSLTPGRPQVDPRSTSG